jgi:hypothetical protein
LICLDNIHETRWRQQRRVESDPLTIWTKGSVADLDLLNLDRSDPGLDHAFWPMAMPDQLVPAVSQLKVLHRGQKGRNLSFDGLPQQLAGS